MGIIRRKGDCDVDSACGTLWSLTKCIRVRPTSILAGHGSGRTPTRFGAQVDWYLIGTYLQLETAADGKCDCFKRRSRSPIVPFVSVSFTQLIQTSRIAAVLTPNLLSLIAHKGLKEKEERAAVFKTDPRGARASGDSVNGSEEKRKKAEEEDSTRTRCDGRGQISFLRWGERYRARERGQT